MTDVEKIEIGRCYREIVHDLRHVLKKYHRIMAWDVPELDEKEAREPIFRAQHNALAEVEAEG